MRLDLPLEKLSFLLKHLDWTLLSPQSFDIISRFLDPCQTQNTHKSVVIPYSLALIAVKTLLNIGVTQYEILEQNFESLQD